MGYFRRVESTTAPIREYTPREDGDRLPPRRGELCARRGTVEGRSRRQPPEKRRENIFAARPPVNEAPFRLERREMPANGRNRADAHIHTRARWNWQGNDRTSRSRRDAGRTMELGGTARSYSGGTDGPQSTDPRNGTWRPWKLMPAANSTGINGP